MEEGKFEISTQIEKGKIVYRRRSTIEDRLLVYDPARCVGCLLCEIPCPVDAIELGATGSVARDLVETPSLVVDMAKCTFCGICAETCPFNSYEFYIDGESIRGNEHYLTYDRSFEMDDTGLSAKGSELKTILEDRAETCPRGALVAGKKSLDFIERECIYCQGCVGSSNGLVINVKRAIEGAVEIDNTRCQGCGACRDICPTKAPYYPTGGIGARVEKVVIDERICNYCGACEKVCPVEAIKIKRVKINYRKGKVAPWTKMWTAAFENLKTESEE
ncbi:NADH-quinone oxidoreductase subunit I [archaeon BMS3Bbin16]|nr:NADH-quinone oxidoreductase subunit I [archaeon BMS3Bbin16]